MTSTLSELRTFSGLPAWLPVSFMPDEFRSFEPHRSVFSGRLSMPEPLAAWDFSQEEARVLVARAIREVLRAQPSFGQDLRTQMLAALYADFAEEDRELAEAGVQEYGEQLKHIDEE